MGATAGRTGEARERLDSHLGDKWRLERLIGLGGMGAVYEARHRNGTRAAVKVLHADLAPSPEERLRFRHEAYIANRVEHPAVVRVLDDEENGQQPYLVMELVDGEPLDMLTASPLREPELLDVAEQVLDALVVAHARGVIHRDIKPQNLLLDRTRRVRILDFGIAHVVDGTLTPVNDDVDSIVGTIEYMAPELVMGRGVGPAVDIFALGATLFTLASGEHMHRGSCTMDQIQRIVREPPRSVATVAPHLDPEVIALVDRATRPLVKDRFASAEQMRREVRRIRARLPACTWDLGRAERAEAPTQRFLTPRPMPVAANVLDLLAKKKEPLAKELAELPRLPSLSSIPTSPPAEPTPSFGLWALAAATFIVLVFLAAGAAVHP